MFGQSNGYGSNGFAQSPMQARPQAQNVPSQGLASLESLIQGGGASSFFNGDSPVGAQVEGEIVSVDVVQARDYQSGQPDFWQDGSPKQQIHIVLQTSLPAESADDDGRRSIWVKAWGVQLKALRDACRQAGVKMPDVGDRFAAKYVGLGERGKAPQPPKLFEYRITPKAKSQLGSLLNTGGQSSQSQQAPVQQTVQTPQQQASTTAPQVNATQVQSLLNMGKTVQEIAGFLGTSVQAVEAVIPPTMGQPEMDTTGNPVF